MWSKHLAWGYFDHPPVVAWLGAASRWGSAYVLPRLGGFLLSLCGFWLFANLCRKVFRRDEPEQTYTAVALWSLCFVGLLFGNLLTPDVGQFFFWILCLHESVSALQGKPWRWLSAGAALGLGLLAKYTLILLAPIMLIGIWYGDRKQFKTRWPYLGMLAALLCFLPHVVWNANNDWATFRFQLKRGFTNSHTVSLTSPTLAEPIPYAEGSKVAQLAHYFDDPAFFPKPPKVRTPLQQLARRLSDFLNTQLLLWGFFLVALVPTSIQLLRRKERLSSLDPRVKSLIYASACGPLLFFGAISFFTKVEGNWPATYASAAALLFAGPLGRHSKQVLFTGILNLTILCLLMLHTVHPFLGLKAGSDRLMKETSGYENLAKELSTRKPALVLFDAYQLGSMLTFYAPDLAVQQWAGITRPSEFVRNPKLARYNQETMAELQAFDLLTYEQIPPVMPGFEVATITEVRNCLGRGLVLETAPNQKAYLPTCPGQTIRRWFIVRYMRH